MPGDQPGFGHEARVLNAVHPGTVAATNAFIRSVWGWMALGLTVAGTVAAGIGLNDALFQMVAPMTMPLSILMLFGFWFSGSLIGRSDPKVAALVFLGLSALEGVVLSVIFQVYQLPSVVSAFAATAGTFGAMSVYGTVTKRDLTEWRSFLMMGLWGIIIASVVNIFMQSHMLGWLVTYAGVLVFTGLIAFSTQQLVQLGHQLDPNSDDAKRMAVMGALMLFVNFINLLLTILRFVGVARDD